MVWQVYDLYKKDNIAPGFIWRGLDESSLMPRQFRTLPDNARDLGSEFEVRRNPLPDSS